MKWLTLAITFCAFSAYSQMLDPTFGSTGKLIIEAKDYHDCPDMTVDQEGRLMVLVNGLTLSGNFFDNDIYVFRLLNDGQPDSSFAVNGVLNIDFIDQGNSEASDLLVTENGDIVIAGFANSVSAPGTVRGFVQRFDSTGVVDLGFGESGTTELVFHGVDERPERILEDDQGRLIVVGGSRDPDNENDFSPVVACLNSDGQLDSSFASTGMLRLNSLDQSISSLKTTHISGGSFYDLYQRTDSMFVITGALGDGTLFTSCRLTISHNGDTIGSPAEPALQLFYPSSERSAILDIAVFNDQTLYNIQSFEDDLEFWIGTYQVGGFDHIGFSEPEYQEELMSISTHDTIVYLVGKRTANNIHSAISYSDEALIYQLNDQLSTVDDFGQGGWMAVSWGDGLQWGATASAVLPDGSLVIAGRKYQQDGSYDIGLVKILPNTAVSGKSLNRPNPGFAVFQGWLTYIDHHTYTRIYSLTGQLMYEGFGDVNLNNWSAGGYVIANKYGAERFIIPVRN